MFAFAVWDERARRLLLARDRVGKKPLFYAAAATAALSFASELQALLAGPGGRAASSTPPRSTPTWPSATSRRRGRSSRDVRKLPPGPHARLARTASSTIERYWRLDYSAKRAGRPEPSSTRSCASDPAPRSGGG